jgi:hypothetical protein
VVITADGSGYSIRTAKQGNAQAPPTVEVASSPATTLPTPQAAQPTPTVQADRPASLLIAVTSLTSPAHRNSIARLTIRTLPGAASAITVYYKSGPSHAGGLESQTADANGDVTWSWQVGGNTTPGIWKIVVTASAGGVSVSKEMPFEVVR